MLIIPPHFQPLPCPLAGIEIATWIALLEHHERAMAHHAMMTEICSGEALAFHTRRFNVARAIAVDIERHLEKTELLRSN